MHILSPGKMHTDLVTIGRVVSPHGIDGTLKVFPLTDFPQHFSTIKEVFLVKQQTLKTSVERVRFHKGHVLLTIEQCCCRNDAEEWVGAEVAITDKDLWPLQEGEYYQFQIIGLTVITDEGECLGQITDILTTGSNDVYIVNMGSKEALIPAIHEVVKSIDLERKVMTVHLLEGLIG